MKRLTLLALLPSTLVLFACDRSDDLGDDPIEERAAELADDPGDDDEAAPRGRRHREGRADPAERLCERLSCTDAQAEQITALFDEHRPERPPRDRGERSERRKEHAAANEALAKAFASDALTAADLAAYHDARPRPPAGDEREAMIVAVTTGLHGLLDSTQRATLADTIEERGLPMAGRGGKHGRRGPRGHRAGPPDASRRVDRLCEPLSCTDTQRTELEALLSEGTAPPEDPTKAARAALAEAFRGEALSASAVETYLSAMAEGQRAHHEAKDALVLSVHGILDAGQRATAAENIGERGLRGLLGDKGHRKGKRRGGKHRKGKRPAGDEPSPEAFG